MSITTPRIFNLATLVMAGAFFMSCCVGPTGIASVLLGFNCIAFDRNQYSTACVHIFRFPSGSLLLKSRML